MAHKKINSPLFQKNRDGVTLLFVISMVVLFLLMGTTFMIVSNDFFKAARQRSRRSTNIVDGAALLDRSFYELLRGPDLRDVESPLRGHSILADQYGYGIVATLEAIGPFNEGGTGDAPLVQLTLSIDDGDSRRILDPNFQRGNVNDNPLSPDRVAQGTNNFFAGRYNGQVVSIVDGEFSGYSGRIISSRYRFDASNMAEALELVVLPNEVLQPQPQPPTNLRTTVVINGRDFSGVGSGDLPVAGAYDATTGRFEFDPDADPTATPLLRGQSLRPNRRGESMVDLADDRTHYLARDNSPNEPYDVADFQNMFLSGVLTGGTGAGSVVVPSFHRDTLFADQFSAGMNAATIQEFSFRPVYVETAPNSGIPTAASTANAEFPRGNTGPGAFAATGDLARAPNDPNSLDVDTDNDGTADAVWIDIGLPTQTDSEGRLFRPLVAYRVVDLDNRLNLNAHGSLVDEVAGGISPFAVGAGYGVAEISLSVPGLTDVRTTLNGTPTLYNQLLRQRYGADNMPGNPSPAVPLLGRNQKLFDFPISVDQIRNGQSSFATALDLFGQFSVAANVTGNVNNQLPGFEPVTSEISPYNVSFSLNGSPADDLFSAVELEGLLRVGDPDAQLISSRLNPTVISQFEQFPVSPGDVRLRDLFTTHSFEVNMPATPRSVAERLNDRLRTSQLVITDQLRDELIRDLTPREMMLGGKLNLNRLLGNGEDDGGAPGVTDDIVEVANGLQQTSQAGNPSFDASIARQLLAKDLYIAFLLVCGDDPPAGFNYTGDGSTREIEYHRMVAQWAVNIVDFRDADSINTPFRFDPTPFDGTDFDTGGVENFIVWGCERPEVLISETFAFHDRQNQDTGTADTVADGDDDWDAVARPIAGAVIELYNPWTGPDDFQRLGAELRNPNTNAVNLSATAGRDPVWRIALKRDRTFSDAAGTDILRTIFFVDPGTSRAVAGADSFYPSNGNLVLAPGTNGVLQPVAGNDVVVGPETITNIGGTSLVINASRDAAGAPVNNRVLNISDPSGGYNAAATFPADRPLDADVQVGAKSNRSQADLDLLWRNGMADNYRFLFLQRLANPTLPFDPVPASNTYNPYLTVDTAGIDLLGMNTADPGFTRENVGNSTENGIATGGEIFRVTDNFTRYASVERGVTFTSPAPVDVLTPPAAGTLAVARAGMFRADDGPGYPPGSGIDGTADFVHTFGRINDSFNDSALPVAQRTAFSWMSWNNRPYASHTELLNVPFVSQELLTFLFNRNAGGMGGNSIFDTFRTEVAMRYGDSRFEHLLRLSEGVDGLASNRFAHFLEFVETPSLFLGVENYLPSDVDLPNFNVMTNAEFNPQVHGLPTFRVPGKININTMSQLQAPVWNNLTAGFGALFNTFETRRNNASGPTDFGQFHTTMENASFVEDNPRGILSSINLNNGGNPFNAVGVADQANGLRKDPLSSSYFANEFKQKMGSMTTTRSSVFAIWITVGYFEVDEFGRLGAELSTDFGEVERNRGFYIVDRSIPVAFEPGKNHNVDRAVLVRSIIE